MARLLIAYLTLLSFAGHEALGQLYSINGVEIARASVQRIMDGPNGTSLSGTVARACDPQFDVWVSGTPEQQIGKLQRELHLLEFARDNFPPASEKISLAGTNLLMSECLAALSAKI